MAAKNALEKAFTFKMVMLRLLIVTVPISVVFALIGLGIALLVGGENQMGESIILQNTAFGALVGVAFVIYFMPIFIAIMNPSGPSIVLILLASVIFGWTGIGWIVGMVIALGR